MNDGSTQGYPWLMIRVRESQPSPTRSTTHGPARARPENNHHHHHRLIPINRPFDDDNTAIFTWISPRRLRCTSPKTFTQDFVSARPGLNPQRPKRYCPPLWLTIDHSNDHESWHPSPQCRRPRLQLPPYHPRRTRIIYTLNTRTEITQLPFVRTIYLTADHALLRHTTIHRLQPVWEKPLLQLRLYREPQKLLPQFTTSSSRITRRSRSPRACPTRDHHNDVLQGDRTSTGRRNSTSMVSRVRS